MDKYDEQRAGYEALLAKSGWGDFAREIIRDWTNARGFFGFLSPSGMSGITNSDGGTIGCVTMVKAGDLISCHGPTEDMTARIKADARIPASVSDFTEENWRSALDAAAEYHREADALFPGRYEFLFREE